MFKPDSSPKTGRSYVEIVASEISDSDRLTGQPCEWRPESLAELRAIVQGKCEGLSYSLNTMASDTTMGMIGAQWVAERRAYTDCLALIDSLRATQRAAHKRHWFTRLCVALGFISPQERL